MNYKLNHHEYVSIVRYLADTVKWQETEALREILMELLGVTYDYKNCYFEVPEKLMQQIAVVNMCDMALTQWRDSNGEIDYTCLGDNSQKVLWSILNNI